MPLVFPSNCLAFENNGFKIHPHHFNAKHEEAGKLKSGTGLLT